MGTEGSMSVPTVANLGHTGEPTHTVGLSAVAALLVDYASRAAAIVST